jgi:hypothetical protein
MKLKKRIILYCLIMIIEISFNNLFSQNVQQKPSRQSSFEAFSQGNYEKAYSEFRELLLTYPKDPLYKYYSGVCLVKLKKNPCEATNLLRQALQEGSSVRTLPSDGLFYLARAQQMSGKFSDAMQSYKMYSESAGKKSAREMDVPEYMKECVQKEGQVADSEIKSDINPGNEKSDSVKIVPTTPPGETIEKPVDKSVESNIKLSGSYEKILSEAIEYQFKADSVTSILREQKKSMEMLSSTEKSALKLKILENEKIAASFQNSADQKYHEAQLSQNNGHDTTGAVTKYAGKIESKTVIDSSNMIINKDVRKPEKQPVINNTIIPSVNTQVGIFSFFEVSVKAAPNEKIVIDPEVPPGLIYRIQLAVFRNPVSPGYFKGISPIYGFKIEGTDKIIYYAGMFRKSADARKALTAVKVKGFKDAFVVALSDSKHVSTDRASLLEKEWGEKPFYSVEKIIPENKADTLTPTLTFRVEVKRSLTPLTEDVVEEIRKISGNKGLDIQQLEDGKFDYLIGKFITFETAAEYSDLLQRNGYREAKVVAWLGEKEIPVETARHLFEKLK